MAKSIGIISLKGGVGKTSSTVALGHAISGLGKKVLLVDGNFSAPNLGLHLKVIDPEKSIQDVFDRKANISKSIHELENFDLLPARVFGGRVKNPFKLRDKLKSIKRKYDYVLIDSSPALNEETLAAMLASDEVLIVTTPDYSTLTMTIKAIRLARARGVNISGLILNKVYGKKFEIPLHEIEAVAEVPILAVIPHNIKVLEAQSEFLPFNALHPKSKGGREFSRLAETLIGVRPSRNLFSGFLDLFLPKQEVNRELYYQRVFK